MKANLNKTKIKASDIIFYISLIAYPVIQFSIMWVGVNANSIALAFKSYDVDTLQNNFAGLANFQKVFSNLFYDKVVLYSIKNSFIWYGISLFICMPCTLLISFYIYKRFPGANFFKVILYVPSFISVVVLTFIFKVIGDRLLPEIVGAVSGEVPMGYLANPHTAFIYVIVYNIYFSFASNMMLYVGAMNSIGQEMIEAARIDGASLMKEFRYIILPNIFSTLSVFLTVGIAGIFTADLNLFLFFDVDAMPQYYTFGYYLFRGIKTATTVEYPYYAAFGLVLTLFAAPMTFAARKLFSRLDPLKVK